MRTRRAASALVVAFLAGLTALAPSSASATHDPWSHVKGTYPNTGYHWVDDFSDGVLFQSSDRCKAEESTARDTISAQLAGAYEGNSAQFRGAWPWGIDLVEYWPGTTCATTTTDVETDFHLDYMTSSQWVGSGHGSYGGHNHSTWTGSWSGGRDYCAFWQVKYPCGYHPSRIHINEPRYVGYSSGYRVKFLIHETSHGMGFYDYCGHTSAANNGGSCAITAGYNSLDRQMIRDYVYKSSPVG